jgi:hypothetical protein
MGGEYTPRETDYIAEFWLNPDGMRPLERPRRTQDENMKIAFKEGRLWIGFIWPRIGTLVNTAMNVWGI